MNNAVQELQNDLKSLPGLPIQQSLPEAGTPQDKKTYSNSTSAAASVPVPLIEIIPLVTLVSLLIEIAARIESIVDAVEKLADLAQFQPVADEKIKKDNKPDSKIVQDQHKEDETVITIQRV